MKVSELDVFLENLSIILKIGKNKIDGKEILKNMKVSELKTLLKIEGCCC